MSTLKRFYKLNRKGNFLFEKFLLDFGVTIVYFLNIYPVGLRLDFYFAYNLAVKGVT